MLEEAGEDGGPRIEFGGGLDDRALPDHGRIEIRRSAVRIEGTSATVVVGIGVTGALGSAAVGMQSGGLVPGLCSMGTIVVLLAMHYRSGGPGRRVGGRRRPDDAP